METKLQPVEILAIGAHPDDVELGCAGTLAKMTLAGIRAGAVDLTAGEMGTRGDKETRLRESHMAAEILGLSFRACLFLPDTQVEKNALTEKLLVDVLRQVRPRVLLAPFGQDTHPDHIACAQLVETAWYKSGFGKYEAAGKPFRPERLVRYTLGQDLTPSFVVDITPVIEKRRAAVMAYASQFYSEKTDPSQGKTRLSAPYFQEMLETRLKFYGNRILKPFGEPFLMKELPEIGHPGLLTDDRSVFRE